MFREVLPKWYYFQNIVSDTNTKMVLLSKHCLRGGLIGAKAMIMWFAKFRLPSDAVTVSSAEELHRRYGDILPALATQNPTSYRLMRVLKARTPPLYVSDAVLRQWLLRYFDAEPVNSAGHLELKYGDRIREHAEAVSFEAAELRARVASR